jgi:hypothetical protein
LGNIRTIWGKLGQFWEYKDNLGIIRIILGKLGQFGKYKDNLGEISPVLIDKKRRFVGCLKRD